MSKATTRRMRKVPFSDHAVGSTAIEPAATLCSAEREASILDPFARSETVILDDGKINAAVIDSEGLDVSALARFECDIRKELCGRPIQFRLSREGDALAVTAVVPTFYSKQLLLRAVQRATAPHAVLDRICVPYPTCGVANP